MKSSKLILAISVAILTLSPVTMRANQSAGGASKTEINHTQAAASLSRLKQIQKMDIANMNRTQKNSLRAEVLNIRDDMKNQSPVIYISGGALILIIILLILLL